MWMDSSSTALARPYRTEMLSTRSSASLMVTSEIGGDDGLGLGDVIRAAVIDLHAGVQHDDAMRDGEQEWQVVVDAHDADAVGGQAADHRREILGLVIAETCAWFVEQQEAGTGRQRERDTQLPLGAVGQVAAGGVGDLLEAADAQGRVPVDRTSRGAAGGPADSRHEGEALPHGERLEAHGFLEAPGEPVPDDGSRPLSADRMTEEGDRAAGRGREPRDDVEQGGLA